MKNIKGAIFDADGTILDSMPMWDRVADEYLLSIGVTPGPELRDELRQIGGNHFPEYIKEKYRLKETEREIFFAIDKMLQTFYFNTAPLKEGVLELLEDFKGRGIKMCVATATDRRLVEPALRRCGAMPYFAKIFTCGEENTSKETPDIYIRAAKFLGTEISETLVFEDALYAVKTVKKAGFPLAAVYDNAANAECGEIKKLADYYIQTFREPPFPLSSI